MIIRLARRADATSIARLSKTEIEHGLPWRWRPLRVRSMMADPEATVIVAESPDEPDVVKGFAIMTFSESHSHLHLLAVTPELRRNGFASDLLGWLVESCRVAGIQRINLEVRRNNLGAIAFYERYGFRSTGIARGYYRGPDRREDARLMSLFIGVDRFKGIPWNGTNLKRIGLKPAENASSRKGRFRS